MSSDHIPASDVAFTPTVKAMQTRYGSRDDYDHSLNQEDDWQTTITPLLADFISQQTSIFFATANRAGQPTIQHRGGPPGFLHVLDEQTIAFADFSGNRQYISLGNLTDNPKAHLFMIDYAKRQRIKVWGTARVVEEDIELTKKLMPQGYRARPERVIMFTVSAWDANCEQHIPQRFEAADVNTALEQRDNRIRELEIEVEQLRAAPLG